MIFSLYTWSKAADFDRGDGSTVAMDTRTVPSVVQCLLYYFPLIAKNGDAAICDISVSFIYINFLCFFFGHFNVNFL
jgi:hypothetical protein